MDPGRRRRRMDADEGGRAVHRDRRARMLTVVVAVQNVLVIACLLVTSYVYWRQEQPTERNVDIHIQLCPIAGISGNTTLKFLDTDGRHKMALVDNKIYVDCAGPYVLYMAVCYKSLNGQETKGMLHLQVARSKTPVSSFTLNALQEVCKELHSIVYLRVSDKASVQLNSTAGFKILNVTVGLNSLLGSRCEY